MGAENKSDLYGKILQATEYSHGKDTVRSKQVLQPRSTETSKEHEQQLNSTVADDMADNAKTISASLSRAI